MNPFLPKLSLLFACFTLGFIQPTDVRGEVRLYSVPDASYRKSDHFTVLANGQPVRTYAAKVSTQKTFKTRSSGHVNDSFQAAFVTLDANEPVSFKITVKHVPVTSARVKPTALGVKSTLVDNTVSFTAAGPGFYVLQLNQSANDHLYVWVNPIDNAPAPDAANTLVIPPGIHKKDITLSKNNQSLYLAPGSVLKGRVTIARNVSGARVHGRGFIDGEHYSSATPLNLIKATGCSQLTLEGISLLDTPGWTCRIEDSEKVQVRNLKLLSYRQNSDGIDPCSCSDVVVEDCFIRNYDDGVVIKLQRDGRPVSRNLRVRRCTIITDHGASLKIGNNELLGEAVSDVVFSDSDLLFCKGAPLAVMNSGTAKVFDVHFENIRIEDCRIADQLSKWAKIPPTALLAQLMLGQRNAYLADYTPGTVRDIYFKNITYRADDATEKPRIFIRNHSAAHNVENVYLDNIVIHGQPMTELNQDNAIIQEHTHRVFLKTPQSSQYREYHPK